MQYVSLGNMYHLLKVSYSLKLGLTVLGVPFSLISSSVAGIIPDSHKRHTGASEPREAVSSLQRFPQPLFGNGRREKRRRQRTAAG